MIPYGHYLKGTVIKLGNHKDYANSAHGMHIEAKHDFTYAEGEYMDAQFAVIYNPNGWGNEAYMTSFFDDDNIISIPNIHDNAVASSIFLMKGDIV